MSYATQLKNLNVLTIFLRMLCLQFSSWYFCFNSETAMRASAKIEKAMRYFNRELGVPDWRTFSLRVLVKFHSTNF